MQRRDGRAYAASTQRWLCSWPAGPAVSLVRGPRVQWGGCGEAVPSGASLFDHRWSCLWGCLSVHSLVP